MWQEKTQRYPQELLKLETGVQSEGPELLNSFFEVALPLVSNTRLVYSLRVFIVGEKRKRNGF